MAEDKKIERIIELSLAGGATDQCLATKLQGEESLNGLFHFWIEVVVMQGKAPTIESELSLLLKYSVTTGGGRQALETRTVKGMVASIMQLPHDMRDRSRPRRRYRLLLVPKLWAASRQSQFLHYEEMKYADMVKKIVGTYGASMKVAAGSDVVRPHALQYGETDWNFIARHAEALGYGYWVDDDGVLQLQQIEGGSGGEKINFLDEESQDTNFEWNSHANVFSFAALYRSGTSKIQQINWDPTKAETVSKLESPSLPKLAGDSVSKELTDMVHPFAAVDTARGKEEADAAGRAIIARRQIFQGTSDARSFAAGHLFELLGHEEDTLNGGYRITSVKHEATQEFSPGSGAVVSAQYSNSFSCIADKQKWAPQREAVSPTPSGLITGVISSLDDPDKLGRYKVLLLAPDKSVIETTWIRSAQRFAQPDEGDQIPLEIDTEVLISFANGDIDQPIIMGALHNGKQNIPIGVTFSEKDTEIKLLEKRKAEHFGVFSGPLASRQQLFMHQKEKENFVSLRASTKQELLLDATDGKEMVQLNDGTRLHWLEFDQTNEVSRLGSGEKTDPTKQQSLILDEKNKLMTLNAGKEDDMLINAGKNQETLVEVDQTMTVKGNRTVTIEGEEKNTVTKDLTYTSDGMNLNSSELNVATDGDHSNTAANHSIEGDSSITLKVGSATVKIESSTVSIKLGSNSVELSNSGVTVKGASITVEGTGNTTIKGSALTVQASGVCTVKGASVALG